MPLPWKSGTTTAKHCWYSGVRSSGRPAKRTPPSGGRQAGAALVRLHGAPLRPLGGDPRAAAEDARQLGAGDDEAHAAAREGRREAVADEPHRLDVGLVGQVPDEEDLARPGGQRQRTQPLDVHGVGDDRELEPRTERRGEHVAVPLGAEGDAVRGVERRHLPARREPAVQGEADGPPETSAVAFAQISRSTLCVLITSGS